MEQQNKMRSKHLVFIPSQPISHRLRQPPPSAATSLRQLRGVAGEPHLGHGVARATPISYLGVAAPPPSPYNF
jgi:hypothetical protein